MTPAACLQELSARGVRLWVEGDALKYEAPLGVLTSEMRHAVAANRAEIIHLLRNESPNIIIPEPVEWFNAIERCFNGNCGAMVAFKAGRGF